MITWGSHALEGQALDEHVPDQEVLVPEPDQKLPREVRKGQARVERASVIVAVRHDGGVSRVERGPSLGDR